jgi:hypothetical protein
MQRSMIRTVVVALGLAVVLASCGSGADGSSNSDIFSSLRRSAFRTFYQAERSLGLRPARQFQGGQGQNNGGRQRNQPQGQTTQP